MSRIKHIYITLCAAVCLLLSACSPAGESVGTLQQKATTVTAGANVNITRQLGNQAEVSIVVDPNNPNRLFAFANELDVPVGSGMFAAFSTDGGTTWQSATAAGDANPSDFIIADGTDALVSACCDPTVTFDNFGNLFAGYIDASLSQVVVAISTDGGATFAPLTVLADGFVDQPTIKAGPGSNGAPQSLWATFFLDGAIHARGAAVNGAGAANVAAFSDEAVAAGSINFGDIAIGPNGQAMITFQNNAGGEGASTIFVHTDADGLGAGTFGPQIAATTTNVGGFDFIPPQADRSVDAEAGLAYDLSTGAHRGRVYLVYTDEMPDESNDTDIFVRFSDDDGATFSSPVRVNDDATTNSQFLPKIALDASSGIVAVSFYDTRNDTGTGDTDGLPNTDAQLFATVSSDSGASFTPNARVSAGTSNQDAADPTLLDIDYGDFTGLTFADGNFYPAWSDNSNSTGDNPNGTLSSFDIYTAKIKVNRSPVAVCKDVMPNADATCDAAVTAADVDGGSFDPDGDAIHCTVSPTGPFGLGGATVTLTCTDSAGLSGSCTALVTVKDVTPPVFSSVPPSITTSTCGSLNFGTATATDNCDSSVTVTNNAPAVFPPGTTVVTWTATDDSGNSVTATQQVTVLLTDNPACCPAGTHIILGDANNNVLTGTASADCILGRGGQDTINGLGGNDFISGGDGDDVLNGGDGNDVVFGGSGQDALNGGNGNDTLNGNDGDDRIQGGAGDDNLSGGQGQDLLQGEDGNDTLNGNEGDDNLQGGNGNDALIGGPNNDRCDGGAGTNTFAQCEFGAPNSCADGVKDGTESDVDCGGDCPKCANGKACVTGSDCVGAVCSANVCQAGTGGGGGTLQASLQVTSDWGAGYCVELNVINNNVAPTTNWTVNVNIPGATTFTTWNGNFSGNTGSVNITPVAAWNQVIPAGATDSSIGFCANRAAAGSGLLPSVVSASGTF